MAPKDLANQPEPEIMKKSEWLSTDYFKDIIEKEYGKGCNIEKLTVASALGKGENYASVMDRVTLQLKTPDNKTEDVTYIVKSGHENALADQMTAQMGVFVKESEMYTKIVPDFEKLFKEVGQDVTFGAKCFKSTFKPDSLVLEDLKPHGFVNVLRQNGLDMVHAKAVLDKIAKFHAASACRYEKQGPYLPLFNTGFYQEKPPTEADLEMYKGFAESFIDGMKTWKGLEQYVQKIINFMPRIMALLIKAEQIVPVEFNVLNHGDFWSNNIMFQYDQNGNIKEVYLVDLQLSKWGSPVQDLQYFIISSCNNDIRIKHFDYLIKYYHDELIKNLKMLNYSKELPKLVDIHIQLLKRGFIGVNSSLMTLAVVLLDSTDNADMQNFVASSDQANEFRKAMYTNPRYIEALSSILPFLDKRGLLDL